MPSERYESARTRFEEFRGRPMASGGVVPCQHPAWTFSGWGARVYLKCSTCPAVMPVCHECGQSIDVDSNGDEW